MNRVLIAVKKMKGQIEQRLATGVTTTEKVVETHKALDMEFMEYCKFQELKSLAVANGKLSAEEGQTIYNYLGETVDTFNGQPVEVKAVLTQIFSELLKARMAA
jgi:hypothetical protein